MPIVIENLTHTYMEKSSNACTALQNINLTVNDGEFLGIIGHTGSGKSTLIQHFNGLMQPTGGRVTVDGYDMSEKKQRVKGRALVGMVFQYPDYQLFDSTVLDDISFGPKNLGMNPEEAKRCAFEAMNLVGLEPEDAQKSPFELSGGKKRRAALAGIIAMRPKYLVLDEPMAGLDPSGREDVLNTIKKLRRELSCAVIMVSHSMEDIAKSAERIIILNKGKLYAEGTPEEIYSDADKLIELGLDAPEMTKLISILREKNIDVPKGIFTDEQFIRWFKKVRAVKGNA